MIPLSPLNLRDFAGSARGSSVCESWMTPKRSASLGPMLANEPPASVVTNLKEAKSRKLLLRCASIGHQAA